MPPFLAAALLLALCAHAQPAVPSKTSSVSRSRTPTRTPSPTGTQRALQATRLPSASASPSPLPFPALYIYGLYSSLQSRTGTDNYCAGST